MLQNNINENEHSQVEEKEKCLICRNLFLKIELKLHQTICMNTLSNDDQEYLDEQLAQLIIDQNFQSTIFSNKNIHQSQQQQKIQAPLQEKQKELNHQQINNQESNEILKEFLESKKINKKQINQQQKDDLDKQFPKKLQSDGLQKLQPKSQIKEQDQQQQNFEHKKEENDQQIENESHQNLNNELKQQHQFDFQNSLLNELPKLQQIEQNLLLNLEIQQNQNQFEKKDQINNSIQKINQSQQQQINNLEEKIDPQKNQFLDQEVKVQEKINSMREKINIENKIIYEQKQYPFPLRFQPNNQLQHQYIPQNREAQIPQNVIRNLQNNNQAQQQQQTNDQKYRFSINQHPIYNNHQFQQQNQKKKFEFKPGMRLTDYQVNQLSKEDMYEYFTQLDLEEQVGYQSKIFQLVKKRVQINETGNCVICMDVIQPSNEAKDIQLDCQHQFHFDCIKQWLQQQKICPVCKEYVDLCLI